MLVSPHRNKTWTEVKLYVSDPHTSCSAPFFPCVPTPLFSTDSHLLLTYFACTATQSVFSNFSMCTHEII